MEHKVALKHVHRIFLEWENCRVVKHAEQCHQPETAIGKNLAEVAEFEWIVFFFCLASL